MNLDWIFLAPDEVLEDDIVPGAVLRGQCVGEVENVGVVPSPLVGRGESVRRRRPEQSQPVLFTFAEFGSISFQFLNAKCAE